MLKNDQTLKILGWLTPQTFKVACVVKLELAFTD